MTKDTDRVMILQEPHKSTKTGLPIPGQPTELKQLWGAVSGLKPLFQESWR